MSRTVFYILRRPKYTTDTTTTITITTTPTSTTVTHTRHTYPRTFPLKVEVLTEERDVARSHEEDLFAKLTDRTDDLEALQESYVSLTDRYTRPDRDGVLFGSIRICLLFRLNATDADGWVYPAYEQQVHNSLHEAGRRGGVFYCKICSDKCCDSQDKFVALLCVCAHPTPRPSCSAVVSISGCFVRISWLETRMPLRWGRSAFPCMPASIIELQTDSLKQDIDKAAKQSSAQPQPGACGWGIREE